MITFEVSQVDPPAQALPAAPLAASLHHRFGIAPEASGANLDHLVWPRQSSHPLIDAVHVAFAEHHPLTLSPDDVWLCIAQGFALHVDANAEALRSRLVRHQGKLEIGVRRDEFVKGSPDNDWQGCFGEFSDAIAEHIGKKRDLVVASFSTTGPVERAASEIVLMSAMKSYFDFMMTTMCGIPRITLLGTVDDWRAIRRRAEVLAELDLMQWVAALLPVLDHFVSAAKGAADTKFWQSMYKKNGGSGGPYVTGWINVLFPYLDEGEGQGTVAKGPARNRHATAWSQDLGNPFGGGPTLGSFPRGLSSVPFTWSYLGKKLPMQFLGGFVGVSQDPESGAVRPAIGWAVQDAPAT